MQKKHKRQNTAINLKQPQDSISSRSSSSSSHNSRQDNPRRFLSGSVYLQAYRFGKDENFSTDYDSFFNSSVEVIISEIDRVSEAEQPDEKIDFKRMMKDIVNKRIQIEYTQAAAKRKLRNSLLLFVNMNINSRIV